jgi:hypothetical protein
MNSRPGEMVKRRATRKGGKNKERKIKEMAGERREKREEQTYNWQTYRKITKPEC